MQDMVSFITIHHSVSLTMCKMINDREYYYCSYSCINNMRIVNGIASCCFVTMFWSDFKSNSGTLIGSISFLNCSYFVLFLSLTAVKGSQKIHFLINLSDLNTAAFVHKIIPQSLIWTLPRSATLVKLIF